eukprot:SAG11_NODE_3962_length_2132_cov_1.013773_3_plen_299_part_00
MRTAQVMDALRKAKGGPSEVVAHGRTNSEKQNHLSETEEKALIDATTEEIKTREVTGWRKPERQKRVAPTARPQPRHVTCACGTRRVGLRRAAGLGLGSRSRTTPSTCSRKAATSEPTAQPGLRFCRPQLQLQLQRRPCALRRAAATTWTGATTTSRPGWPAATASASFRCRTSKKSTTFPTPSRGRAHRASAPRRAAHSPKRCGTLRRRATPRGGGGDGRGDGRGDGCCAGGRFANDMIDAFDELLEQATRGGGGQPLVFGVALHPYSARAIACSRSTKHESRLLSPARRRDSSNAA